MSLTKFVAIPEVRDRLKPLRPNLPRKLNAPLRVEPRSNRYTLVGTAFDYLLRFELQRRAPHAISKRWIADHVLDLIWQDAGPTSVGMDLMADADPDSYIPPDVLAERVRAVLEDAKDAFSAYLEAKRPSGARRRDLAAHAIRLAKLDSVYRALRLEPDFEEATQDDVEDLIDLLDVVPFEELVHDRILLLNPDFGEVSELVSGADADLISGDSLIDIKTTKKGHMEAASLDQMLGYLLLAREAHSLDPAFPVINRLGIYFCRHGYLWSLDASTWTNQPAFPEIEEWFFECAEKTLW